MRFRTSAVALAVVVAGCSSNNVGGSTAVVPHTVTPRIVQTGQGQWEAFPGIVGVPFVGPDKQMWFYANLRNPTSSEIQRLKLSTGQLQTFPVSNQAYIGDATAGPDGNAWFCVGNLVGSITPAGFKKTYPGVPYGCISMATGPDQNIWLCAPTVQPGQTDGAPEPYRLTTSGQLTSYTVPGGHYCGRVAPGIGNVWLEDRDGTPADYPDGVINLNPATGSMSQIFFPSNNHYVRHLAELDSGADGNAYAVDEFNAQMIKVTLGGVVQTFTVPFIQRGPVTVDQFDADPIWLNIEDTEVASWHIKNHYVTEYGAPPFGGVSAPIQGPDGNAWMTGGVFILRVLTVNPASATLTVGQSQPFTVLETNCNPCAWSAKSVNPSIATASAVSNGQFTVTGVSVGSTIVTVSDKKQNTFKVSIQVQ